MVFLLKAELISDYEGNLEYNVYESLILIDLLEEKHNNATIYDKELKIHVQNPFALHRKYEVELHKIQLNLSRSLQKAEDLTRRLMYRYDWIQPIVDYKNNVRQVANIEELKSTWKEIKSTILDDYKGDVLLNYLDEIEYKMNHQNFIIAPMSQYFFFGLIFLGIPLKHQQNWNSKRVIEFSEYEEEQFEETIIYQRKVDNLRLYEISGKTINGSKTDIQEYKGLIRIKENDDFPAQVELTIKYNQAQNIYNTWIFKLEQY